MLIGDRKAAVFAALPGSARAVAERTGFDIKYVRVALSSSLKSGRVAVEGTNAKGELVYGLAIGGPRHG